MKKAFKTEVILSGGQEEKIKKTIGICRYVYNFFLAKNKELYEKAQKFMNGYDFSKWLNNEYCPQNDPWIKEVSSKSVKQSIMNADQAFQRFFKGLSKFPRFKKKKNQDVKAYFIKSSGSLDVERHRIKIPTIGWVRLKEYGYIPVDAKAVSCTVSQKAGRYYVSVLCEMKEKKQKEEKLHDGIGVDLGIKDFATCSHHEIFKNINKTPKIKKLEKSLKRQQCSLSRSYEQNKERKRGEFCAKNRQKRILNIQKLHARLANTRKEYVRYVVNQLVKIKPTYITIEDLNIKGMMKNRHLAKAVAQQNFYYFKDWLTAKCKQHRIELRQVDRFYPSSKLCSSCSYKKVNLSLSERIFICDHCDTEVDRDVNASLNLKYAKEYVVLT